MTDLPARVLFGAAYCHEYQPHERLKTDLDLMAEAKFTVIRVGESVWSTWEPENGRFELDWLIRRARTATSAGACACCSATMSPNCSAATTGRATARTATAPRGAPGERADGWGRGWVQRGANWTRAGTDRGIHCAEHRGQPVRQGLQHHDVASYTSYADARRRYEGPLKRS
ncbi:beta-galactosidase [Streptomyces sp. NPDC057136]|uniref:beta-galactosidase n=1 Tax=Streptomyces sp. NPDC057136 TaxID=3346029 RepID=UPI00363BB338